MVQHRLKRYAFTKDAPTKSVKEESVGGMKQSLLVKNEYLDGKDAHTMTKGRVLLCTWGNKKEQ